MNGGARSAAIAVVSLRFKAWLTSLARATIGKFLAARRKRKAELGLKDLSPHILRDIGQGAYQERRELDRY